MNRTVTIIALLLGLQTPVQANGISIQDSWIREAPEWVTILAAYTTINNSSQTNRRLIKVSSPVFERIEMHYMDMSNGMMSMQKQESFGISAGQPTRFEPGGSHFMCYNPKQALPDGTSIPFQFEFSNGEKVTSNFLVKNPRKSP